MVNDKVDVSEQNKTGKNEDKDTVKDILMQPRPDRRLLSYVPDYQHRRTAFDRRHVQNTFKEGFNDFRDVENEEAGGRRYLVDYEVTLITDGSFKLQKTFHVRAEDISCSGIMLRLPGELLPKLEHLGKARLKFHITPGSLVEGLEMDVNQLADFVRFAPQSDGTVLCGMKFHENLVEHANRHKGRFILPVTSLLLFCIVLVVILMRTESVVYFKFNKTLYLYSIIAATFLLSRYLFATFYKPEPVDVNFTPSVTVIIPCFNEEMWIHKTIIGAVNQFYPPQKLSVIIVDDCSTDRSVEEITRTIEKMKKEAGPELAKRISYVVQPVNKGKREALALGAKMADSDLVVFVDSDSFLDPFAIINVVQPFKDTEVGGVSGRTDVANTYTNSLTKMQAVRYYIAFRIMKASEGYFDAVTCLSGPLSCYRKDLVLKYCDDWLHQKFLGQKATFGDDRSMTNFILRHNRCEYQDTAVCMTIVPNLYSVFLKQQMRWKRSWLRESLIAAGYMWKKEPFMALFFYMGVIVPILAPVIVIYNLIYIPITHRVFPFTFIMGMVMMAALMSVTQLFLRKSTTWLYGIWFCLYYEAVLLWQMPIAWFTFWKSTWGTRMTPADVLEQKKKEQKKDAEAMRKAEAKEK